MREEHKVEHAPNLLILVSRAGLEPIGTQDKSQLIDSINRQKRSNRSFRRFEVHSGYTGYEFVSRQRGKK